MKNGFNCTAHWFMCSCTCTIGKKWYRIKWSINYYFKSYLSKLVVDNVTVIVCDVVIPVVEGTEVVVVGGNSVDVVGARLLVVGCSVVVVIGGTILQVIKKDLIK